MRQLPVIKAFRHILASTLNNVPFAFASQWPWVALLGLLLVGMTATTGNLIGLPEAELDKLFAADPTLQSKFGLWLLVLFVVGFIGFASAAVSWHRYVLKDELPTGIARLRVDRVVWRYMGNLILVGLLVMLAAIPALFGAGLVASALGPLGFPVVLAVIAIVILPLVYRLSVKLPAIALDRQDFRFGDAWEKTRDNWWQLVGLGLLVSLVTWGAGLVLFSLSVLMQRILPDPAGNYADIVLQVGANWILTVFGITTLTSLYGYFVEGREF